MCGKPSAAVERAVRAVRRDDFLTAEQKRHAGEDVPLPIGQGQTTSQPSLVAEMTRELGLTGASRVLEVGTGSGYQTAILAEIAAEVFTVERLPELAEAARVRLVGLGYSNIRFRVGDGARGWPEAAPFNAIIVTAAPRSVPAPLLEQLAPSGRMVIPVGETAEEQVLVLLGKDAQGRVWRRDLFGVRFVPLLSD